MTYLAPATSIALIAYSGAQMSAVLGLEDMFTIANRYSKQRGGAQLRITHINSERIELISPHTFSAVILPPTLSNERGADASQLQGWLKAQHRAGATMCSACAGAYWLGHCGLLDGRPVTTHWALEQDFQATFPAAQLNAEQLLIDDNDIVTAGGLMAWLDLGLYIINRWLGAQIVSDTARHLLIDPSGREQRNYRSFRPILSHGDPTILQLQHWLESHAGEHVSVQDLTTKSRLSPRTFLRRFKAATTLAPRDYIQNLRIEKARGLLERTRHPIAQIGWDVGYQDASAFARVFKSITGLSAGEYRHRFGVLAD